MYMRFDISLNFRLVFRRRMIGGESRIASSQSAGSVELHSHPIMRVS